MQNIFYSLLKRTFFLLLICSPMLHYAQVNWTVKKPFEQKNFVENKGQFEVKGKLKSNEILYEAHIDGVRYYFTKKGYLIEHLVKKEKSKVEIESERKGGYEEKKENSFKMVGEYHELLWEGANPNLVVETEEKTNNYYTCSDSKNAIPNATFKSSAFKKLIYKNMYPNIDVVFEFMKDTVGIKYSLIVHYGADLSKVKMVYPISKGLSMDKNGNMNIASPIGIVTDHKPFTYIQSSKKELKSSFVLKNKKVGFKVDNIQALSPADVIVIDPWTISPNFAGGSNKVFDVDYDKFGNVYAYGGVGMPFYLNKYTPAGTLIWTYSAFPGGYGYYGDFAIDINSGSIYIVEGVNFPGATAVKLSHAGVQTAIFAGNQNFTEMWRIAFSRCTNNAVIAGGGISSPTYQTCYLDTNLINTSPVQYIPGNNCCQDINCLALDNYGFCYQMTNSSSTAPYTNTLVKLPMPALAPDVYHVPSGYTWYEAGTYAYYNPAPVANGANGIATSNTNVYTYDGYVLKKWNGANGAQLVNKRINFPAGGDSTQIYCGGITADECDNLFIGDADSIKQYDSSFVLISANKMNGDIYDLKLATNSGVLYACGNNFISQLQLALPPCNNTGLDATITSQDVGCSSLGSASIVVSGGTPPYSITWNTNPPQTGASIYNLEAGTYVVTVIDSSCIQHTRTDTVVINSTSFSSQTTTKNVSCPAVADGAALIDNTGGTAPYTYKWSNGQSGTNLNSISGLAPGNYTVEITDNAGCKSIVTFVIDTAGSVPNFALLPTNIFTPNGDNVNDIYFPFDKTQSAVTIFASSYSLVIFNRWGNKVFETTDAKIGWDGKMPNGKDASPGVYFWMMDVTINCAKEPNTSMKGFLHLDR